MKLECDNCRKELTDADVGTMETVNVKQRQHRPSNYCNRKCMLEDNRKSS